MKWKLSLLLIVLAGGIIGSWIKNLPGMVIIAYAKTTFEMRLWVAVSIILILFTLVIIIFQLLKYFFSGAKQLKYWHSQRAANKAGKKTLQGILAFAEARWPEAEKLLVKAADHTNNKLINYLLAAQAAQYQNAEARRDNYLRLAHLSEPTANFCIGLTQAKLQIKQKQYEQALASLKDLKNKSPTHTHILQLLSAVYEKLEDWDSLYLLLADIRKYNALSQQEYQLLEERCIEGLLNLQAKQAKLEGLQERWSALPGRYRKSHKNQLCYAQLLISFQQMAQAEVIIRNIIKKQPNKNAIKLYTTAISDHPQTQLNFLERLIKSQAFAPKEIYLALGKMAYYAKLWGKAKTYLEQALEKQADAEAYLFMAKTLDYLGDRSQAMYYYQQGLSFVVEESKKSRLPKLAVEQQTLFDKNTLSKLNDAEFIDPV